MPWPTYESLPKAVKTMLKNLGAGKGSKLERQWRHVANSCLKKGGKEVSCIKQANSVVQKAAKGDNAMPDMQWSDIPESSQKKIKESGSWSQGPTANWWMLDFSFCKSRGGTDNQCVDFADMFIPKVFNPIKPEGDMQLYHEPIIFDAEEGEVVQDSITGKDVYKVPITATRQGVMNARYKPWEELQKSFWTLERKPIIAPSHPPGGEPVTSAVFDNIVGFVSDVYLDDEDKSLRGFHNYFMDHAWVVANLDKIGKEQQATSVGYYAITEHLENVESFEGISYNLVDRFMYFDHNAHLVNIPAACPVPSCGIMVNEEGYNMTEEEIETNEVESTTGTSGMAFDLNSPMVWFPPEGTNTITWTTDSNSTEDAKHAGKCPPGKHMVGGKCVDKDSEEDTEDDCTCNDSETESEGEDLNTQKSIKLLDNMTEDETTVVESPEATSVEPAPTPRATVSNIEARVLEAENRKLQDNLELLQNRLSELENVEKERKDAEISRLREIAVELNSELEAFSEEEISEMDEKHLGTAIKALQVKSNPSARAIFGNVRKDTSPYRSSEFAPLTVFAEKESGE